MLIRTNQYGFNFLIMCAESTLRPSKTLECVARQIKTLHKENFTSAHRGLEMCHDIKIVVWVNATKKVPLGVVIRPSKKFFSCLFSIIAHDPC